MTGGKNSVARMIADQKIQQQRNEPAEGKNLLAIGQHIDPSYQNICIDLTINKDGSDRVTGKDDGFSLAHQGCNFLSSSAQSHSSIMLTKSSRKRGHHSAIDDAPSLQIARIGDIENTSDIHGLYETRAPVDRSRFGSDTDHGQDHGSVAADSSRELDSGPDGDTRSNSVLGKTHSPHHEEGELHSMLLLKSAQHSVEIFQQVSDERGWSDCCQKLGQGAYGSVYQCYDKLLEKDVAVKVVPIDGDNYADLGSEVKVSVMLSSLDNSTYLRSAFLQLYSVKYVTGQYPTAFHQAGTKYYEGEEPNEREEPGYGDDQKYVVFVFELGGTSLRASQLSTSKQAFSVLHQTLAAVAVADEELSIVHGDLHDGNILITADNVPEKIFYWLNGRKHCISTYGVIAKLIDFGLSKCFDDAHNCFEHRVAREEDQTNIPKLIEDLTAMPYRLDEEDEDDEQDDEHERYLNKLKDIQCAMHTQDYTQPRDLLRKHFRKKKRRVRY